MHIAENIYAMMRTMRTISTATFEWMFTDYILGCTKKF